MGATGAPEAPTMAPTEAPKDWDGATGWNRVSKGHTTRATIDEMIQEATEAMGTPKQNNKGARLPGACSSGL